MSATQLVDRVHSNPRPTYPQNWRAYDKGQAAEFELVRELLASLASTLVEPPRSVSKGGRPSVPLADQLFGAVLKVWEGKSGRRTVGVWEAATRDGFLQKPLGRMTIQRFLNRADLAPILSNLVTISALPLAGLEQGGEVAPDSTGIQTTCFGAWRETKHGEARERRWLKVHAMVGTRTHVVIRAIVTQENGGDSPRFEPLLRWTTEAGFTPAAVVADKGYLSKANYRLADALGVPAFIPFKSNSRNRVRGESSPAAWRKAFHLFQAERDRFDVTYHRRSNVESVFSALKRKFREEVRSRNLVAQTNEILCTLIAYNLSVVVHEMFEHGIAPSFIAHRAAKEGVEGAESKTHAREAGSGAG